MVKWQQRAFSPKSAKTDILAKVVLGLQDGMLSNSVTRIAWKNVISNWNLQGNIEQICWGMSELSSSLAYSQGTAASAFKRSRNCLKVGFSQVNSKKLCFFFAGGEECIWLFVFVLFCCPFWKILRKFLVLKKKKKKKFPIPQIHSWSYRKAMK